MKNKEKVKYILNNCRKARAKGHNLIIASKAEYSTKAKTTVGGNNNLGKSDSEQEKHIIKKEKMKEDGQALLELSEAVSLSVNSLPQRQRITIKLRYFEDLKPIEIGEKEKVDRHERTVERFEAEALDKLIDWGVCMIYDDLKNLLKCR